MNHKEKKYPELNALKGRLREYKISYRKLAKIIGIAINTLSDKINGFYPFNSNEIEIILETLDIKPEEIAKYFFPKYLKIRQPS